MYGSGLKTFSFCPWVASRAVLPKPRCHTVSTPTLEGFVPVNREINVRAPCCEETAVERIWHTQDSQGQVLALAFRQKPLNPSSCSLFTRKRPDLVEEDVAVGYVGRRIVGQLLHRNVRRFRGGLVFRAHRLCGSLNSRLESNKEEESSGVSFGKREHLKTF